MNGYISRKDRICNHRWQTPTQNDFLQISLNKQVSQTGLFIVELTPLILFQGRTQDFLSAGANSVFVRFRTNIATRNSPAKSDTMLEKKHLVFLAGATAPFAPPLCTALYFVVTISHLLNHLLQYWQFGLSLMGV